MKVLTPILLPLDSNRMELNTWKTSESEEGYSEEEESEECDADPGLRSL